MEAYCVKDGPVTPNVRGTAKIVATKSNRRLLKVKCAVCGITKTKLFPGIRRKAAKWK